MSNNEMVTKITELKELRTMKEELENMIADLEDSIKSEMGACEELFLAGHKITWKQIAYSRFDTATFKRELPDIAARYTKTVTTRRFIVA